MSRKERALSERLMEESESLEFTVHMAFPTGVCGHLHSVMDSKGGWSLNARNAA